MEQSCKSLNSMSLHSNASQVLNTFINLVKELEAFTEVSNLKIAFDREGNAFLIGPDFQEQLHANPVLHREVKAELRQIIAQRCPRISPEPLVS
jgi:hypothetical protein